MDKPLVGCIFSHNKHPDHLYRVIDHAINCTNGVNDGQHMIIYKRTKTRDMRAAALTFVRDAREFSARFTPVKD